MKKKVVPLVAKKIDPEKLPKKPSRRLTNKERDAACKALIDYMMVVAMPKEEMDLLTSVINKIRVEK